MENMLSGSVRNRSPIHYDYATIKITPGRLNKGLIAFPISIAHRLPDKSGEIKVILGDSAEIQSKPYSSHLSRTHESRINGLRDWFKQEKLKNGDEIVIQFIDQKNNIYRLIKESDFIMQTRELEKSLDNSNSDEEASSNINTLADWTKSEKRKVFVNEFYRLANSLSYEERHYGIRRPRRASESVPAGINCILADIYQGHCQVCDFSFLNRKNQPYFETHHLDPRKGHHPKNILVVCGNCHNEFEYANVKPEFDKDAWLIKVALNEKAYLVRQAIFDVKLNGFFKETYTL